MSSKTNILTQPGMSSAARVQRILIVDDNPQDRYAFRRFLSGGSTAFAFEFIESDTGEEGLRQCAAAAPDCVLLDYHLPDLDGIEFLLRVRRMREGATLPIIVLTGAGSEALAVEAMKGGAEDYLRKDGVSGESLVQTVQNAIEKAGLRRKLDQAEEASRMKDEFLAVLSHELRTPLNAILGWLALIQSGRIPAERLPSVIQGIDRNARAQAKLIEDLLDVSGIVTGKFSIRVADVNFTNLIQFIKDDFLPSSTSKGVSLTLDMPQVDLHVRGDLARLQQALSNILSNALKFTQESGAIDIVVTCDESAVEITIRDTGVGISPEFLPFAFDRFRQANASHARTYGGLGLGLSIVKHIVVLHGGTVSAQSKGIGHGTAISVSLPRVL
jgi:signal transduction histidine kinase